MVKIFLSMLMVKQLEECSVQKTEGWLGQILIFERGLKTSAFIIS